MGESTGGAGTLSRLLPRPVQELSTDLKLVLLVTLALLAVLLVSPLRHSPLRAFLGVPFVLFVPGYLLISALFPEMAGQDARSEESGNSLSNLARFGLSFPASILVVAPLALVAVFTPWGLQLVTIFPLLLGCVFVLTALARQRRVTLAPNQRYHPPLDRWLATARTAMAEGDPTDRALTGLLWVSILLATGAVIFGVAVPPPGEPFTEMYLTSEDGSDPLPNATIHLSPTETEPLHVTVRNREHERVQYELLVVRQRVSTPNNSVSVLGSTVTDRYRPVLSANQTWEGTYTISGGDAPALYRVAFLLYRDGAPSNPTIENAYRQNNIFVNVTG